MTFRAKLTSVWIFFAAFLLTPSLTWAQGLVQGIVDKMFYDNRAAFIIPTQAGFEYSATLNGAPIPVGVSNYVTRADYYELQVRRTETASGSVTDQLVRFLVVARAERGTSERGLPSWTPYPLIHCATGELAAAELHIVAPKTFPLGLEIPVIGILRTSDSRPVRANGLVTSANFPEVTLQLRRGWGSAFLPPASSSGPLVYDAQLHSLQTNKQIAIEAETTWTTVGGTLSSSATWPANSRIHVASHLLVTTGNSLTIEQGTVVRLAAGVEIRVNGQLFVNGTTECPVVFTPTNRAAPWGGIVLRTNAPRATITGAIFTRSGASATWMSDNNGGSTHRSEQPLIYLGNGAQATLTDCYAVDHRGQFGHGETATLRMTRTLVQKFTTGGQFNSGSVRLDQCAIIEIPSDDDVFADDDNDAFYLTGGNHSFTNCLVGWAKDDGLDAGSGAGGSVAVIGCWFESCYHEGMAWSTDTGTRNVTVRDTVVLNCGQGIEAGFGDPEVFADHCVSIGNLSGARFGDNYDWSYSGFLRVTNSFLLHNYRNIFGRTWAPGAWTNELDQMDLRNNYLSAADTNHPNNFLWQPDQDGWRLAALMSTPPDRPVGVGFARRTGQASRNSVSNGLVVGLSSFTTNCVAVDYAVETPDGTLANGTLEFTPGEIVKTVPLQVSDPQSHEFIRVALHNPAWAELSGITRFYFMDVSATPPQTLIAAGSTWKFLDTGVDAGTAWRALDYPDGSWREGAAPLGYGDPGLTEVRSNRMDGTRITTTYFRRLFNVANPGSLVGLTVRLRRDDGGVVYLNETEVFRSNMTNGPTVPIRYTDFAGNSTGSETAFNPMAANPNVLHQGDNIAAVEIHQQDPGSSDIAFDLEVIGGLAPTLQTRRIGDELLFFWNDPAYRLIQAAEVGGPWGAVPGSVSPATVMPSDPRRFYRLVRN